MFVLPLLLFCIAVLLNALPQRENQDVYSRNQTILPDMFKHIQHL